MHLARTFSGVAAVFVLVTTAAPSSMSSLGLLDRPIVPASLASPGLGHHGSLPSPSPAARSITQAVSPVRPLEIRGIEMFNVAKSGAHRLLARRPMPPKRERGDGRHHGHGRTPQNYGHGATHNPLAPSHTGASSSRRHPAPTNRRPPPPAHRQHTYHAVPSDPRRPLYTDRHHHHSKPSDHRRPSHAQKHPCRSPRKPSKGRKQTSRTFNCSGGGDSLFDVIGEMGPGEALFYAVASPVLLPAAILGRFGGGVSP